MDSLVLHNAAGRTAVDRGPFSATGNESNFAAEVAAIVRMLVEEHRGYGDQNDMRAKGDSPAS